MPDILEPTPPPTPSSGASTQPNDTAGADFDPNISRGAELLNFIWELLKVVAVAVVLVIVVKTFLVQPFCVRGASMQETYNSEDYILIDKLGYRFHQPKRFDVIVFRYPFRPSEFFIKRIIALPSESVEIKNNNVTIYSQEHPEGIVIDESSYVLPEQPTGTVERKSVAANEYFVMGDNRPHSFDSRQWGALPASFISGRVFSRVLSQSRFCHLIGTPTR